MLPGTHTVAIDWGDQTPNTLAINLLSVNDPPTGAPISQSANEDVAITFAQADFTLTDTNDSPPNILQAVKIASLPTSGSHCHLPPAPCSSIVRR